LTIMLASNAARADPMQSALVGLLHGLRERDYSFVTITPESHARVLARDPDRTAADLRDVFGWNLPFAAEVVPHDILECLHEAEALAEDGPLFRSRIRVSTLHGKLFVHSAFPTDTEDAVFFGPDSYRFADFIRADLIADPIRGRVLDIGAGSGVGAIVAAQLAGDPTPTLTDINPAAFPFARANAEAAGRMVQVRLTPDPRVIRGAFDLIVANPPFIADEDHLPYRDGGGMHGCAAALDWADKATEMLNPGGRLLLYAGSAIVAGEDRLLTALHELVDAQSLSLSYRELDPDIFGDMLDQPPYADVDRIAAVGARIDRPR
jgi:methylase of polypeptide subunit release factors